jgi:hypothetical protein
MDNRRVSDVKPRPPSAEDLTDGGFKLRLTLRNLAVIYGSEAEARAHVDRVFALRKRWEKLPEGGTL